MDLHVAEPHGMCTGVARALRIAEQALAEAPEDTLWCFHEIVHNEHVVAALRAKGARFVNDLAEIPEGARVLFSAHGVSPEVRKVAEARRLRVIDATCPFVAKVHREALTFARHELPIALIGHKGHDEVVGILGEAPQRIHVVETREDVEALAKALPERGELALLSQTTISFDMFRAREAELIAAGFELRTPDRRDICTATWERQEAVRTLAANVDAFLVLGSRNSSNSKRLVEVAQAAGCPAHLLAAPEELESLDLSGIRSLGLSSGASTPEDLLQALLHKLQDHA